MRVLRIALAAGLWTVLAVAAQLRAEPLNLKQVPADAKWLAHVDVDALKASTVFQNCWHKAMEMHKGAEKHLDMVREKAGLDLRHDLHGITLYGKEIGKHTGVAIITAKVDQKLLAEKANQAPDHKLTKYGAYDLHTWTDKHHGKPHTVAGAFYKDDRVVFASSLDELKAAIDVLDGKGSPLSEGTLVESPVPAGATWIAGAKGISSAAPAEKCPVAKQIDSVQIVMGESAGQSFFRAKAVTTNSEISSQLKAIVDGARAMAALHAASDPVAKKLVDAAEVKVQDKSISIAWSSAAADVWGQIEKHAKAWAEKRGAMKDQVKEKVKKRIGEHRKNAGKSSN